MGNVISVNEKKMVRWGAGIVVFITKEAKRFGWSTGGKVRISAVENGDTRKIVIEELK